MNDNLVCDYVLSESKEFHTEIKDVTPINEKKQAKTHFHSLPLDRHFETDGWMRYNYSWQHFRVYFAYFFIIFE